jgi:DnaJ-like protein
MSNRNDIDVCGRDGAGNAKEGAMSESNGDPYSILGVARTATDAEIKQQYRFLSHAYHPDKFATQAQRDMAGEEFKRINEAYDILSDSAARAYYDASHPEYSGAVSWDNLQSVEALPEEQMAVWKQILLWIAVLPGTVVGSTLAFWITKYVIAFNWGDGDGGWQVIPAEIFSGGAWGYALVFCAAYIAPRAKITVAIIFAAFGLSLVTLAAVVCIRDQRWWDLVSNITSLVGSIIAAVSIAKGEEDVGQHMGLFKRRRA